MLGERIKQARVAAGLSLRELSDRTNNYVSAQAIHKYELGRSTAGSDVLIKLAQALAVPVEFFFRPHAAEVRLGPPAYRKRSTVPSKELLSISVRVKDWVERYVEVESLFPDPRTAMTPMLEKRKREITTVEEAEQVAERLRTLWNLGDDPIQNVVELLEDHGVKVVLLSGERKVDGLSCWANERIPVLVVNRQQNTDRIRLSLLHELGHLIMHVPARWTQRQQEQAAFRFGAAFLAPATAIAKDLGVHRTRLSLYELQQLRGEYGMSVQALIYRCKDLRIIAQSVAATTFASLRKRRMMDKEFGEKLPVYEPLKLERLVIQAIQEDLMSESRGAELLKTSVRELRKKLSVGDGSERSGS